MKKTMMVLAALLVSVYMWAETGKQSNATRLQRLAAGGASQAEVKELLGEPEMVNSNNKTGRVEWQYPSTKTGESYSFQWSDNGKTLTGFTYNAKTDDKLTLPRKEISNLDPTVTKLEEGMQLPGSPESIRSNSKTQDVRYRYSTAIVEMHFVNRVLMGYKVYEK